MKKFAFMIIATSFFVCCSKENAEIQQGAENNGNEKPADYTELTVSLEQPVADDASKTILADDESRVLWEEGDAVAVIFMRNYKKGGTTTTKLNYVVEKGGDICTKIKLDDTEPTYFSELTPRFVMFPYDAVGAQAASIDKNYVGQNQYYDVGYIGFTIPFNNTPRVNGSFGSKSNIALGEVNENGVVVMKNLLAVIKFTLINDLDEDIKRAYSKCITVGSNKLISGVATYIHPCTGEIYDQPDYYFVGLTIPDGIIPANSKMDFYFPIYARTEYPNETNFNLWIHTDDAAPDVGGITDDRTMMAAKGLKLQRNTIYEIPPYHIKTISTGTDPMWGAKQ